MPATLEDVASETYDTWGSLNTAVDATKLSKDQTPSAVNAFPDEKPGSIVTAPGYEHVGDLPSGNPCRFMFTFEKSDGTSMVLCSDNATVYKTTDFITFTSIITGLSSAFQLRAVTIRDKVWLTNGNDSVRTYNGTTVVVLDGTAGTPTVPKGKFIEVWQERVWLGDIPSSRSSLRFSALVDSSGTDIAPDNASAWPAINEIQCGQDDGDVICGLKNYIGILYPFKAKSIYRIDGQDEFTYQPTRTGATTGSRVQESIQERDNLLEFIGRDGLYEFDGNRATKQSDIIESIDLTQFSFNNIQQGTNQQKSKLWTTQSDFTGGTLTRVSATREANSVIIDNYTYPAEDLPTADPDNPWTKLLSSGTESVSGGILTITATTGTTAGQGNRSYSYYRSETLSNTNGMRFKIYALLGSSDAGASFLCTVNDGTREFNMRIYPTVVYVRDYLEASSLITYAMTTNDTYHTYEVVMVGDSLTLYVDGVSVGSSAANTVSAALGNTNRITFGVNQVTSVGISKTVTGLIDYVSVLLSTISGSQALSDIYQITDTISLWGAFQASYSTNGGSVAFYVRSGTSSANCSAAAWTAITPGATIAFALANVFIQWRCDFTASGTSSPQLDDVTINWNTGSATAATSQPAASVVFKNRYWLSGASLQSSSNDTLLLRGRRLYNTPWIKMSGFNVVAFCIYNNQLYAASSTNDDILRLDTGYSLAGSAMDSYWETRDEVGGADEIFYKRWPIVVISGQKKGNYTLSVGISIDGGETYPSGYAKTISLSGSGRFVTELRYPDLRGKQIRVRVRTNGVDQPWDVSSIKVFWRKKFLR